MNSNELNGLIEPSLIDALPPTVSRDLLRHAMASPGPAPERRVFANRDLRMEKIRFIGFDLDWTLANYSRDAMSELAFKSVLDRLIERHGYPKTILKCEFRADFARRGLMLDKAAGMVIKMNRHRYVGRAFSGRRFLSRKDRADLYRRESLNPNSSRFYLVDTLFELPELNIFSEVIELERRRPGSVGIASYDRLFQDIHTAIDTIHADGSLKASILADLEHYLPRDPETILALKRMAFGGRKLMLITNSEHFFTEALCSYLFDGVIPGGGSWREIFDLVIVSACKPSFFRGAAPFTVLDDAGHPVGTEAVPEWGKMYSGGSREGLMKLLDAPGEQVLYVGDHIYGDVVSTKLSSTWRTALVVSELEDEIRIRRGLSSQLRHLDVLRSEIGELGQQMDDLRDVLELYGVLSNAVRSGEQEDPALEPIRRRLKTLHGEHKGMRQHARRLQERVSTALNPHWGSLFKQGSNKSFFGSQVDDFACIYTSRVDNFAYYGSDHYFRVQRDAMMHETEG